jgi:glycerophosphoryl diester phosphodiesterase
MAHRGASKAAAGNTLAAFRLARELGADSVELDVRRLADGELAVHHDPVLADGRTLYLLRASELPPFVPLLDAALDACAGMTVNVEIKNLPKEAGFDPAERAAAAVIELVRSRHDEERVLVSSFHLATIDRVREQAPDLETAYLVQVALQPASLVTDLVARGHRGLHPWHKLVTQRLVRRCHDAGLAVRPWTVDDPGRIAVLGRYGVDAICTNVPDVALAVLRPAASPG